MNGTGREDSAIVVRGVHVSRGSAGAVLRGLDLDIARGETLALVGRSGAGKSTLLKLINGLLVPERGEVLVEGRSTRVWNPYELRRRIGYVLQEIGLFPHMSVADNIGIVPRLLGWEPPRIAARDFLVEPAQHAAGRAARDVNVAYDDRGPPLTCAVHQRDCIARHKD